MARRIDFHDDPAAPKPNSLNRAGIDGGFIGWKGWSSCQVDLVLRIPLSVGIRRS
ncbi:hypothetical protein [Streptosporangium sp. H16]|uniref:hypothetical protein n=1 Tax=Streptosporangium sp. H16 TaxID=3444184 RepID=UPI003F79C531